MGWASAGAPWGGVGAIRPRRVCWVPGGRPGAAHSLTGARAPAGSLAMLAKKLKVPSKHWSKTVFATDLLKGGRSKAIACLNSMKADYTHTS